MYCILRVCAWYKTVCYVCVHGTRLCAMCVCMVQDCVLCVCAWYKTVYYVCVHGTRLCAVCVCMVQDCVQYVCTWYKNTITGQNENCNAE